MGLLDGLLGSVLSGAMGGGAQETEMQGTGMQGMGMQGMGGQGANPLLQLALQMLQKNGGIGGLLQQFQQAGYSEQAQSWVSTGKNLPIDASVLEKILGQGQLGQMARQSGMSHQETAGGLASMLPQIIDEMTPQGAVPNGADDMVSQVLAQLQKR
jgi:uncharacterized protein YidB (DUF937 family)